MDILPVEGDPDGNLMEVLVGTQCGCIMHSTIVVTSPRDSKVEALDGF